MGSAASVGDSASSFDQDALSKEELVGALLPHFKSNPAKYEEIYQILVERTAHDKLMKEKEANEPKGAAFEVPTAFTSDMVLALNSVRLNPKSFIPIAEAHLESFSDATHYKDKNGRENMKIRTREGKAAVLECIEFLKTAEPVRAINANLFLQGSAMDHVEDLSTNNTLSHSSSNGDALQQRIENHGTWRGTIGEIIDCGNNTAENIVLMQLIDDGTPSRGHRLNCLNPDFLQVGAAINAHPNFQFCCVVDFATNVLDWGDVQKDDVTVETSTAKKSEQSAEFRRVLHTIPMDNVIQEIDSMLSAGDCTVTIEFKASTHSATVLCKKGSTTRKMQISWGAEKS
jgi:uncharacterized protein YkwD